VHHRVIAVARVLKGRPGPRAMLSLLGMFTLLSLLSLPTTALADGDAEPPPIRWAVTPADSVGGEDRVSIQRALDPGESAIDSITVQNLSEREVTFRLSAADGFTTSQGRFDMLASDQESTAAGTWIDIADTVTVDAGESVDVPFTITVPAHAEPGDHPAGVAASVITEQRSEDGTNLGVESRVGVKVITRVTGELAPALSVDELDTTYIGSWNPFRPGQVTATFQLENTGNTRLSIAGSASAGTGTAAFPTDGEPIGDLLPGDVRQITVPIDGVWPSILLRGELNIAPEAAALDGTSPVAERAEVSFRTWAIPWAQLIVLISLALLIAAVIGNRRRGRRRLDALLEQARAEGRASAGAEHRKLERSPRDIPSQRAARAPVVLGAALLVLLAPITASAAPPSEETDGVGVTVTITERADLPPSEPDQPGPTDQPGHSDHTGRPDGAETGPKAPHGAGSGADAEADSGADAPAHLPRTGIDLATMLTLAVAGLLLCAAGMILRFHTAASPHPAPRTTARGDVEPESR